jgi:predicted nucleotidyltransferase
MQAVLEEKLDRIVAACVRHGVSRLDVFGSALRDGFRPGESDIDFLVEFSPMDHYARAGAYFDLPDDLRELLGGKIDLVMAGAVRNRYIAAEIDRTRKILYAAA